MFKNKKVRSILQIALSIILLGYLVWRVGPGNVLSTLANISWVWYAPAFFLFLVNLVIRAYRWYILLNTLNQKSSLPYLTYLYFVSFFFNNFIPSGFGGDVVKVVSLRQTYGRGTEALSSVVMDRVTGLLGSVLIALLALIWNAVSHTTNIELPVALWATIIIISIGMPLAFAILRWLEPLIWLTERIPLIKRIPKFDKVESLAETVQRYSLAAIGQSLLTSLPFTIILVFIQYLIARALDVRLPIAVFSLFVPIISILNLLPISFNGLGVREGVYQFLFVPIGVSATSAVAMSLAFYFVRFAAGMVGGVMYGIRSLLTATASPHTKNS